AVGVRAAALDGPVAAAIGRVAMGIGRGAGGRAVAVAIGGVAVRVGSRARARAIAATEGGVAMRIGGAARLRERAGTDREHADEHEQKDLLVVPWVRRRLRSARECRCAGFGRPGPVLAHGVSKSADITCPQPARSQAVARARLSGFRAILW